MKKKAQAPKKGCSSLVSFLRKRKSALFSVAVFGIFLVIVITQMSLHSKAFAILNANFIDTPTTTRLNESTTHINDDGQDHSHGATNNSSYDPNYPFVNHVAMNATIANVTNPQTNNSQANLTSRWTNAVTVDDGNLQIEFFDKVRQQNKGMAGCLINLEDTIRMAEWLPYHYATLPLGSVVIALDPKTSERGIQRTLELIDLWKDKIEITLWPEFFLPKTKRFRKKQPYTRERQVYFVNQCLAYHKEQNQSWTLLTDNDEYIVFNYVHVDESLEYDHPGAKKSSNIRKEIKSNRKKYMPLRKDLPIQNQSTILEFIQQHERDIQDKNKKSTKSKSGGSSRFLPKCVRLPGIRYGVDLGVNETFVDHEIIEPRFLSTLRYIHHGGRVSKFSKTMIDVSNITSENLKWTKDHAKTIHNPSSACKFNSKAESGADYPSSLFRLNHYQGSLESYLERHGDYRKRNLGTYKKEVEKVKPSGSNWDTDIASWVEIFVRSVGGATEAKKLLAPLVAYQKTGEIKNHSNF